MADYGNAWWNNVGYCHVRRIGIHAAAATLPTRVAMSGGKVRACL